MPAGGLFYLTIFSKGTIMAFKHMPDLAVPASEFRCEAMTKACKDNTFQVWRREPHRCVRRAKQGRAGRIVCALHGKMPDIKYWDGEPDTFPWSVRHHRNQERRGK